MNINNAKNVLSRTRCLIHRHWKPDACITLSLCTTVAYSAQWASILNLASLVLMSCLSFLLMEQYKLLPAETIIIQTSNCVTKVTVTSLWCEEVCSAVLNLERGKVWHVWTQCVPVTLGAGSTGLVSDSGHKP